MKNFLILTTFLIILSACKGTTTTTESAANYGSCILGKWSDSSLPLSIKMSSDFTGDYSNVNLINGLNPIEQMAKVWNDAASPKTLMTVPFPIASTTGYTDAGSFRDSELGIYKSYTWFNTVGSGVLAITQFYGVVTSSPALGQYIALTHADVIVNYRDFGQRLTVVTNPRKDYDVPTIVLHELGHLMGLCHESKRPSIMAPAYITTQRNIQTYDADLIKNLYVNGTISGQSAVKVQNTNTLKQAEGTQVRGTIELHADGKCIHYLNGQKTLEHSVDVFKQNKKGLH